MDSKTTIALTAGAVMFPELAIATGLLAALAYSLQVIEDTMKYIDAAIDKAEAENQRVWAERVERRRLAEAAKPKVKKPGEG